MDTIEQVGALVGIAAFVALAAFALLYFLQAREVRRLRDWAGRAPERAAAIAAREELEAESERAAAAERITRPSRMSRLGERLSALGRRLPIDPLYVGAILIGLVVAVGFVTSGFGFIGGGGGDSGSEPVAQEERRPNSGGGPRPAEETDVAVLNATQIPGVSGVPGIAQQFATEVTTLGYRVVPEDVGDASGGLDLTAVMFRDGNRAEARQLASRLEPALTGTPIQLEQMSGDVIRQIGNTELALVIGRNYTPPEVPAEPTPAPVEPPVTPAPVP